MLCDIITRKLPSRCILIQDSVEQSGHVLLEAFIQRAVNENKNVIIFCFETPVAEIQKNVKCSAWQSIKFYDCFHDHRNWLKRCGRKDGNTEIVEINATCLQRVACSTQLSESDAQVVFIDSLGPLISNTNLCDCYIQVHKLCDAGQVVLLVHEDAVQDAQATLGALRHLATTCLRVCPPVPASQGSPLVEIRHSKPGGGVLRQTERFTIGKDKEVTSEMMSGVGRSLGTSSRPPDTSQLPPDLTTFKLDLEKAEIQARSKLVLPYIRPSVDQVTNSGGKVFYQPDAADDWDEEDPDDDLDI